jgi:histone H1/5
MPADRPEVLTSLPRSRPTRRSAKRGGTQEGNGAAPAAPKPKPKAAAAPKAKTAPKRAKAKPAAASAKPKAAARPKRAAAAKPRSATPAKPKASAAKPKPAAVPPQRPEPIAPGAPDLTAFPTEPPRGPVDPPSGGEILQSAAKAAGELAQAGITVGREALKQVVRRLPRP